MAKVNTPDLGAVAHDVRLYAQLKSDNGSREAGHALRQAHKALLQCLAEIKRLPPGPGIARREPNALAAIRRCRPSRAVDRLWPDFQSKLYSSRLKGALLGRMAGCTLGAPVELWPVERMKQQARDNREPFPPRDYWSRVDEHNWLRYGVNRVQEYVRPRLKAVPVDDDIAYTLLGLLVLEDHGLDFTLDDLAADWQKYLPMACTAEDVALRNLKQGVPPEKAGEVDNPFSEWIGAAIRADAWAYVSPGWPARAAELAWRDGFLTHRRTGLYSEMYFAAAIAAAFAVDDPMEALRLGLGQIPRASRLAGDIRWAIALAPSIKDYRDARHAVDERFPGMNAVHAANNACLTIFGVAIGRRDFTRTISQTVAMGLDNDCTAATAGSLVGAVIGSRHIPDHWSRPFRNRIQSYLIGHKQFSITGVLSRFTRLARLNFESQA